MSADFRNTTDSDASNPFGTALELGAEFTRDMTRLHLTSAARFVQTQVDFLGRLSDVSDADSAQRLSRDYTEVMCSGMRAHAEGLMGIFSGGPFSTKTTGQTDAAPEPQAAPRPKEEQQPEEAPPAPSVAEAVTDLPPPTLTESIDDLTEVNGIGRVFAAKLASLGITTFAALAKMDLSALDDEAHPLHELKYRIEADEWLSQARKLAG